MQGTTNGVWSKGSCAGEFDTRKTLDNLEKRGYFGGGADQDRTGDLLNAIQALSQLSYSPTGDDL
jgi:hypothetical protein